MLFIWDPHKADQNVKKHGVSFEVAQTIFDDPLHISIPDSKMQYEERWTTMGQSVMNQFLIVVHTYVVGKTDLETIRIISARKATKKERKQYEEGV